ncbi:hypothetical protein PPSIR1_24164 [Plesiocystis pacifica SIR-1]|uniref:Uncharacterized protein n=1 Tax=Plesiocystis pacifica SIR-1 TaxID=391625 RepID=A6GBZ7_9BACT|nr:hypothetical protein [Plesiocystis pacifica]EDM76559.1 hypothetical protein PPSIR1_24164 [Plesiocystis pacifica SIR-1]
MVRIVEPDSLVDGDDWFIAHYLRTQCVYFGPQVSDQSFEKFMAQFEADIVDRPMSQRIAVLYYVPDIAAMDSPRRRQIAGVLKEQEEKLTRTTAAFCVATRSPLVRGVLSALFWLAPPGYPNKITNSPDEALRFLAEHLSAVNPERIGPSFTQLLDRRARKAS